MSKDKEETEHLKQDDDVSHKKQIEGGHGHDGGSHGDASKQQRKQPEAGVRTDTRWGDDAEEMFDIHGRVLSTSIVGGHTELLIGAGRAQGVHVGMTGYMMKGDTYYAQLDVIAVDKKWCRVKVDATIDQIKADPDGVRINPSSVPARASTPVQDYKSRVLKVDVVDSQVRITIAGGSAQGVGYGMHGVMLDDTGRKIASFEISELASRSATAFVQTTVSEVYRSHSVIVNPQ